MLILTMHKFSVTECKKRALVHVNESQWMWWQESMAWLQVCLLFMHWEWTRMTANNSNNTRFWSSHQSFTLCVDKSILLQWACVYLNECSALDLFLWMGDYWIRKNTVKCSWFCLSCINSWGKINKVAMGSLPCVSNPF